MPPKHSGPALALQRAEIADANDEIQPADDNVSDAGSRASGGSRASRAARRRDRREAQRSRSRSTSEAGTFTGLDDGHSAASSSSSVAGTSSMRLKAALGEPHPGYKNREERCFCSEAIREMLDLAIKDKKITEDDGIATNVIVGFLRAALQAQEFMTPETPTQSVRGSLYLVNTMNELP